MWVGEGGREVLRMNLKGFHFQRWKMPDERGGKDPGEKDKELCLGHNEFGMFL